MFQNIQYIKYKGYYNDLHHSRFLITDSDFSEESIGASAYGARSALTSSGASAVINCYFNRYLDVPLNLALYHRQFSERIKEFGWNNIEENIEHNIKYVPKYKDYIEEVKKYLDRFNHLKVFW